MRRLNAASCRAEHAKEVEARSARPSRKRIIERHAKSLPGGGRAGCDLIMTTSTAVPAGPPAAPARRRLPHPDPVVRRLSWMVLVNTVGNGLFMTVSALYFTRVA